mmetsp:Transcript_36767/g.36392  ORF Transcript_36767/g.36392 Transcript_36767/m.36392 type:complete len:440 (-) Transcript_36767:76-1395(-)
MTLPNTQKSRPSTIIETLGGKIARRMNQELLNKESRFIQKNVKRAIHHRKSTIDSPVSSRGSDWNALKNSNKKVKSKFSKVNKPVSKFESDTSPKLKKKNAEKFKLLEKSMRREYEERINNIKRRYEDIISALKASLAQAQDTKKETIQINKDKAKEIVLKNTQKLVHKAQISSLRKKVSRMSKNNFKDLTKGIVLENDRLAMQLEDISMKLHMTTKKLRRAEKELYSLKNFASKYHNIDIDEMHKTVRNLENELEMYKKKNAPQKGFKVTNRICTVCTSQIDNYNNRVKKIIVEGGRNREHAYPANVFLSSDEEEDRKEKRKELIAQQTDIMKQVLSELKGYSDDVESFGKEESATNSEDSSDMFGKYPVMRLHAPNDEEPSEFMKKYLAFSNVNEIESVNDSDFDNENRDLVDPRELSKFENNPDSSSTNKFLDSSL